MNELEPVKKKTRNYPTRPLHVKIVQLYLQGCSYNQICREAKTTKQTISRTLKTYAISDMLDEQVEQARNEISALVERAIDAVRRSLNSDEGLERLKAADMIFKLTRMYETQPKQEETATTQMQKILEMLKVEVK
jgi:hypothetical protein